MTEKEKQEQERSDWKEFCERVNRFTSPIPMYDDMKIRWRKFTTKGVK